MVRRSTDERNRRQSLPWRSWGWLGLGLAMAASVRLGAAPAAAQAAPVAADPAGTMSGFQAIVLGIVQGLTEFLPISSTAHLKAVPVALGWGDPGVAFTAVIQLGSIAAVLSYFWADLVQLARGSAAAIAKRDWQAREFRLVLGIALGTLPIAICGVGIKLFVPDFDNSPVRSMTSIAIVSIVMALLLGLAEVVGSRQRGYDSLGTRDGWWMGVAQTLALMPGVSRSGSTLTAGLFGGLERAVAARFSFLLGIPAITLAGLVELAGLLQAAPSGGELGVLGLGLVASALSSYAAIAWLLRFLQTQNTWVFVAYRLIFGVAILAGLAAGVLSE